MYDFLRQRLSPEEQEAYDRHDGRAAFACHFVMWPVILAIAFYASGMLNTALVFVVVALVALPAMLWNAKRARALRELADQRYRAIMDIQDEKSAAKEDAI